MTETPKAPEPGEKKEAKQPSCNPPGAYADVTDTLRKIKKERDRSIFVLIVGFIEDEIWEEVYGWRRELREVGEKLDILIDSPGGALTSCYSIARMFSRCTDAWEALVPTTAASGATLICLGSSAIVMSEMARLGPLDPQVISKRREKFSQGERQSPLEAFEAVRYLRRFAMESLDFSMRFLLEERGVSPHLALSTSSQFALRLVEPVIGKVEPYDLGSLALDSRVAIEYCKRIGNPAPAQKKTQRGVDPRKLVESYPGHEFFIDVEEAKALNFAVSEPTPQVDELFDVLRPQLGNVTHYAGLVA